MCNFAAYISVNSGKMINYYHHNEPFALELGGQLDQLRIAYHTYGTLNADKSNVVLGLPRADCQQRRPRLVAPHRRGGKIS